MRIVDCRALTKKEAIDLFQKCMTDKNEESVKKAIKKITEQTLDTTCFSERGIYEFCMETHRLGEEKENSG
jgi:hypothetical protein